MSIISAVAVDPRSQKRAQQSREATEDPVQPV